MPFIGFLIVAGFVIWEVYEAKKDGKIPEKGIEADAVVIREEDVQTVNDDKNSPYYGRLEHTYTCYVKFMTQNGSWVEAKLENPPVTLSEGSKIRIRYLPGKLDHVFLAE